MDGRGVVLWVAGFAGVLFIYSAFKGSNPFDVITTGLSSGGVGLLNNNYVAPGPSNPNTAAATPGASKTVYTRGGRLA